MAHDITPIRGIYGGWTDYGRIDEAAGNVNRGSS